MNIEDYISFDDFAYTARFYEKDSGKCILEIPSATKPIKVVFDTHEDGDCVEYGKENLWGAFEWDIDVATDEELSLFVKGG